MADLLDDIIVIDSAPKERLITAEDDKKPLDGDRYVILASSIIIKDKDELRAGLSNVAECFREVTEYKIWCEYENSFRSMPDSSNLTESEPTRVGTFVFTFRYEVGSVYRLLKFIGAVFTVIHRYTEAPRVYVEAHVDGNHINTEVTSRDVEIAANMRPSQPVLVTDDKRPFNVMSNIEIILGWFNIKMKDVYKDAHRAQFLFENLERLHRVKRPDDSYSYRHYIEIYPKLGDETSIAVSGRTLREIFLKSVIVESAVAQLTYYDLEQKRTFCLCDKQRGRVMTNSRLWHNDAPFDVAGPCEFFKKCLYYTDDTFSADYDNDALLMYAGRMANDCFISDVKPEDTVEETVARLERVIAGFDTAVAYADIKSRSVVMREECVKPKP